MNKQINITEVEQKLAKVSNAIMTLLQSPNRSVQRADLWFKLQDLREKLNNSRINYYAAEQADSVLNSSK